MAGFKTKYRSSTFDEYIGNDLLKTTVLNRFATDQPYPVVTMVYGASGCGKTTIARLIAKQVMCEDKITKNIDNKLYHIPCNKCDTCLEIDNYIATGDDSRLASVNELDATKARRSDAIDEFIQEASIPNMYGTYNIHILDEAHMLSVGAQNNLLKFLEDAPPKTLFMICTTDPQKIISTIHTRVDLFLEVLKPTLENNIELLESVCKKENITYDRTALALIAERAKLVYRSSLSSLENVFRGHGIVSYKAVVETFGEVPTELYFKFFGYLLKRNIVMYTQMVNKAQRETGLPKFIENLTDFTKRGIYVSMGLSVEGVTKDEVSKFKDLFSKFSQEEIFTLLQFLDTVREGDIETRLLILGYRGLTPATTVVDSGNSSEIRLSEEDIASEKKEIFVKREGDKELARIRTLDNASESLKPLDKSELLSGLFNS